MPNACGFVTFRTMFFRILILTGFALSIVPARAETPDSQTTAHVFDRLRNDPARLTLFLRAFPKGGDLHNHLAGAIPAEDYLRWAGEDGLCVSLPQGRILPGKCRVATPGDLPATQLAAHDEARQVMIDSLSMHDFVPTPLDRSGHDHFFSTFGRFAPVLATHQGEMLAQARDQAAADHIVYLELMISPALGAMARAGEAHPLPGTDYDAAHRALDTDRAHLVSLARQETDTMEHDAQDILHCDTPQAHPGCSVTVRYLFQAIRTMSPAQVFAQLDTAYQLVHEDPRFVGVNFVAPEDNPVAMKDYAQHMQIFAAQNARHPDVKLSLHAGELTPSLVPANGLDNHIRQAVEIAGASRIGHGVDILWEHDAPGLLHEMAQRRIAVEVNLTSNDQILGVSGKSHPLSVYRRAHVPVTLSTDDQGVSRSNLTQEYRRAIATARLGYADLKAISRNSLTYAFIPGTSLWDGDHVITLCRAPQSFACANFLRKSEKARLQFQLERNLAAFEAMVSHEPLFQ
ncbi:adenosine deaminase [Swaminathania salitolerans LMG 21291]|uniref:adenosine deaminase n=2 Tax=Swaminathania salitolerans TaxID=182838 RepID=A0A511BNE8_9PROT|nr:adenosine deaminase [Swaminathania salitolerans]GBQ10145.1 adenosine deaminase [Swaminathania salitolerans LMG 21291]GEL01184.1 adenosine deaminase [Swaminathania salitolerans]